MTPLVLAPAGPGADLAVVGGKGASRARSAAAGTDPAPRRPSFRSVTGVPRISGAGHRRTYG